MYANLATQLFLALAGVEGITTHEATLEHDGRALTARYHATPDIELRQIGQWLPNRPSTAACLWTARLAVKREVHSGDGPIAAFARAVQVGESVSGRTPGRCATARKSIQREAAQRLGGSARLQQLASLDRPALVAELDSAR